MAEKTNLKFSIDRLFTDYLNGDKDAERKLLEHLTVSFRLFAKHKVWDRHDAEEIVQDALITIINKCRDIEFETSFAVWAYKVLRNKIMNHVATKNTRKKLLEREYNTPDRISLRSDNSEIRTQLIECFKKISKTNIQHARILNLKYQGYTTEEICRTMRISKNNMYVILSRARAALEICLNKGDAENE